MAFLDRLYKSLHKSNALNHLGIFVRLSPQNLASCEALNMPQKRQDGRRVRDFVFLHMALVILSLFTVSCTSKKESNDFSKNKELVAKGNLIYNTKCTVCHNQDPSKPGAVGPEIAESSVELIRLKTRENKYPERYTPKRQTQAMTPMPELTEDDIKALYEFLSK